MDEPQEQPRDVHVGMGTVCCDLALACRLGPRMQGLHKVCTAQLDIAFGMLELQEQHVEGNVGGRTGDR